MRGTALQVEVVRGGRPDEQMLVAIEQAVRTVLASSGVHATSRAPAWGLAARIEATGSVRIMSPAALARAARD
jgi:hypothetical protein